MYHEKKSCGGEYEVGQTDDGLPFLECSKCQHKVEDWIAWYREYSNYWSDESKWDSKRDHPVCLLGWFCHLYKEHYGEQFSLSLNDRGFFRSGELHQIRKLYAGCNGDAKLAKQYVSWVFAKKIAERKRKITSLGFLNVPAMLNEFRQGLAKASQIGRATPLPPGMLRWLDSNVPALSEQATLRDFGDLKTLLTHVKRKSLNATPEMLQFIDKLQKSRVINEQFEIARWSE